MELFTERLKKSWRSLTVWFGLLLIVLGALLEYAQGARADIEALLRTVGLEWIIPFIWPAVGVIVILLRLRTTKALEHK